MDSTRLRVFQKEQQQWADRNFPGQKSIHPFYGMVEEVGELHHAVLKLEQGIRVTEDHAEGIADAVGDILIYTASFCTKHRVSLVHIWKFDSTLPDWTRDFPLLWMTRALGDIAGVLLRAHTREETVNPEDLLVPLNRIVHALHDFCRFRGLDMETLLFDTWDRVKKRDWQKNPRTGV